MKIPLLIKLVVSILVVALIVLGILFTKLDINITIFFLIPIVFFSVQKGINTFHVLVLSVIITTIWFFTFLFIEKTAINSIIMVNTMLRFGVYFTVSYLFMTLTKQRAALQQKNEELKALSLEKNIILGTAAHDIRNSSSAIYSFSEILLEQLKDKDHLKNEYRISSIINGASSNQLNLVSNLLDFSKIDSGQITINKISTDYNSFIENRIELLQIIAQQKSINIVFHRNENLLNLTFDPIYLSEVIDNLISNAIKYSKRNCEIFIDIKIENQWVTTEVIDSGIGIKSSEIEGLFQPFHKSSNKPTSGESSTGLGLYIAQKVVRLHGGSIGVESKVNEGSRFYFSLPFEEVN